MIGSKHLWAVLAGALGVALACSEAKAADPPGGWVHDTPEVYDVQPVPPATQYTEMLSGWYLRGDVGYRFNKLGDVSASQPIVEAKYNDNFSGSLGAGFKYRWLRFDATFDYTPPTPMQAKSAGGAIQPQYSQSFTASTVLANAYIDFGTWAGFTPYVGAGLGASILRARDYADTSLTTVQVIDNTSINVSWAWMAGVAFQIKPTWIIDIGYRHLALGDLQATTGTGVASDSTTWRHISANEARIGLRMLFD